jgi:hypothetical protein
MMKYKQQDWFTTVNSAIYNYSLHRLHFGGAVLRSALVSRGRRFDLLLEHSAEVYLVMMREKASRAVPF